MLLSFLFHMGFYLFYFTWDFIFSISHGILSFLFHMGFYLFYFTGPLVLYSIGIILSTCHSFHFSKIPTFHFSIFYSSIIPTGCSKGVLQTFGTTRAFHSSTFPQNSKHTIIILHSNICLHNAFVLVTVKPG